MDTLDELRQQIDLIDNDLLPLLCRRMDLSGRVAAYKEAHGLPVYHPGREQQILARVKTACAQAGADRADYGDAAALVYSTIMDASRALQHRALSAGQTLRDAILAARSAAIPAAPRIVCAGCPGAYADEAADGLYPGITHAFVETFGDVFDAVGAGEADIGIVPIENSSTGSVHEVYDQLIERRFAIVAAVDIPVRHCLLARPGADPAALKTVYSHPQGLAQCAAYIAERGLTPRPYGNTATAAAMVAAGDDDTACAISSRKAAELYHLDIVADNIQTVSSNSTRFLAIASRCIIPPDAGKISLLFALPHVTGALYRILARFAAAGLNLTKIESRPMRTGSFEYVFYLDFQGNAAEPATLDLLCALSEELPLFSFLGNYREQAVTAG